MPDGSNKSCHIGNVTQGQYTVQAYQNECLLTISNLSSEFHNGNFYCLFLCTDRIDDYIAKYELKVKSTANFLFFLDI